MSFVGLREWDVDKILFSNSFTSSKYVTKTFNEDDTLYLDIKRGKSPKYDKTSDAIILNQKCIRWNHIDKQYAKTVSVEWLKTFGEEGYTQVGDILINSTGEGTIGRATIVDEKNAGLLYDSHILLLRLNKEKINPEYFVCVFNSRYGQEQVNNVKSAKTTQQTELGVENLKKIYIPIPAINIQEEIAQNLRILSTEIAELQDIEQYRQKAVEKFEQYIY